MLLNNVTKRGLSLDVIRVTDGRNPKIALREFWCRLHNIPQTTREQATRLTKMVETVGWVWSRDPILMMRKRRVEWVEWEPQPTGRWKRRRKNRQARGEKVAMMLKKEIALEELTRVTDSKSSEGLFYQKETIRCQTISCKYFYLKATFVMRSVLLSHAIQIKIRINAIRINELLIDS